MKNTEHNQVENDVYLDNENISKYDVHYSEDKFWKKLFNHYKIIGKKVLELAISLYYAFRDDDTPSWAKKVIIASLGYFIFPLDLLPDFIPAIGYSDDLGALLSALAAVALYIKDEHKEKAEIKIKQLFYKNSN